MEHLLTITGIDPVRWLGCLLIATLAAHVALDHVRHLARTRLRPGVVWLAAGALALGTGVWSAQLLYLASLPQGFVLDGWPVASAWLSCCLLCMLALGLVHWGRPSRRRLAAACLAFPLAVLTEHYLVLRAVQGLFGADDAPRRLLIGAGIVCAGSVLIVAACQWRRRLNGPLGQAWQGLTALLFAVVSLAGQHVSTGPLVNATPLPEGVGGVAAESLALLASIGTVALLLVMWISSSLEAQMRTSLRRAKAELQRQALVDPLTGLPNRGVLEARLAEAVDHADSIRERFALLVIDMDGFKPLNELHGHKHGDRVLQEIAGRLHDARGAGDTIARMSGNEFAMLLRGNPTLDAVRRQAAALVEAIALPCRIDGRESALTCSIGVALYPLHGDLRTLNTHADAAMRAAKSSGGATHCVFESRMVAGAREQADLLRDLREAVRSRQFELYFQPKIHAPSGQITGAEALLRWHHPTRGMVSPVVFIPLAERYGLIDTLGDWVIDEACRQSGEWRDRGLRMRIAINLSAHQLRKPDLPDRIGAALARHHVNAKLLTCEITESVAMEDGEQTMRMFERLAAAGVHISIDDFGTGYSSLSYLRKLPAEELKIDRSFVSDLETSGDARAVVDAVIKLAQALGLKVVAEGVETEQQSRILRSLGCDELQGFLFARPMPAQSLWLWAMGGADPARPLAFRDSLFGETQPAIVD